MRSSRDRSPSARPACSSTAPGAGRRREPIDCGRPVDRRGLRRDRRRRAPADVDGRRRGGRRGLPVLAPALRRANGPRTCARIARGLRARAATALVRLQMLNNGKPRGEAEIDVGDAVATFDYYAGPGRAARRPPGQRRSPLPDPAFAGTTRFEPVGPVGMIVPWNFPLVTSAWKIAPALAAGCTVVLKTSEFTPLIELAYGDIAQEVGLPAGVLNLVTGSRRGRRGADRATARLRKLSFTGSQRGRREGHGRGGRALPAGLARARRQVADRGLRRRRDRPGGRLHRRRHLLQLPARCARRRRG